MILRLLAILILAATIRTHPEHGIPVALALVVGFGFGYRSAVRTNGASMVRAGTHRLLTGRF